MAGLVYVRGDKVVDRLKRHGRFSVPLDCARSAPHFKAALVANMKKMAEGFRITHPEYRLVSEGFEWRGPLPHIEFADATTPDPEPLAAPDPLDREASERWERAEKARRARVVGDHADKDLVDFQIILVFERTLKGDLLPTPSSISRKGPRG